MKPDFEDALTALENEYTETSLDDKITAYEIRLYALKEEEQQRVDDPLENHE